MNSLRLHNIIHIDQIEKEEVNLQYMLGPISR